MCCGNLFRIDSFECNISFDSNGSTYIINEVDVYKDGVYFGVVKNIQEDYIEVEIKSKNKYLNGQIIIIKINK